MGGESIGGGRKVEQGSERGGFVEVREKWRDLAGVDWFCLGEGKGILGIECEVVFGFFIG